MNGQENFFRWPLDYLISFIGHITRFGQERQRSKPRLVTLEGIRIEITKHILVPFAHTGITIETRFLYSMVESQEWMKYLLKQCISQLLGQITIYKKDRKQI